MAIQDEITMVKSPGPTQGVEITPPKTEVLVPSPAPSPQTSDGAPPPAASLSGGGGDVLPKPAAPDASSLQHEDVLTPAPNMHGTISASASSSTPSTSVVTASPFGEKTINTKTGEAAVDGKPVTTPAPTATAPKPATTKTSTAKTAKQQQTDDAAQDLLTQGMDFVKGMMEGGDPTVQRTFNKWLSDFAKTSAAQRASFMMNMRSQPGFVEGSGEGTAAMLMLARANGTDLANMMSKMSIENVRQMGEWNKYGIDKSIQIQNHLDQQVTNDLNNELLAISADTALLNMDVTRQNMEIAAGDAAMRTKLNEQAILSGAQSLTMNQQAIDANKALAEQKEIDHLKSLGQYDKVAELLNKKYPGIHVDAAALRASDAVSTGAMNVRLQGIQDLIEQGDAEAAKAADVDFHRTFWKQMGFASPEEAVAFAEKKDYTKEAYTVRMEQADRAAVDMRKYAAQNDSALGRKSIEEYFRLTGANPEAIGKGLALEQVNEMRKFLDPKSEPLTSLVGEDMKALGVDWEWYQQRKRVSGANEVNTLFEQFAQVNPALAQDPEMERMTKAWLMKQSLNQNIIPDPSAPGGFRVKEGAGAIAPWDDPETAHYFTTWPVANFNGDGTFNVEATGGIPYSFLNGQNYGPYSAAEDKRLDDKYNAWLYDPKRDRAVTRDQWFYATKGGTVDFNKSNIPPSMVSSGGVENRLDPAAREKFTFDFKNTPAATLQAKIGDNSFIENAIGMGAIQNLTNPASLPQDSAFWTGLNSTSQGIFAYNGTGYSVGQNPRVLDTTYSGTALNPGKKQSVKQVEVIDSSGTSWFLILSGSLDGNGPGTLHRHDPTTGGKAYKPA
jgi:hypothetical protein